MNCDNCGEVLRRSHQRFCNKRCKQEYWNLNVSMSEAPQNILRVLVEERCGGPISIDFNSSVWSLSQYMRVVPLIIVRDQYRQTCVIEITDAGRRWYAKLCAATTA